MILIVSKLVTNICYVCQVDLDLFSDVEAQYMANWLTQAIQ